MYYLDYVLLSRLLIYLITWISQIKKLERKSEKLCIFLCTLNKKPLQVINLQGLLLSGGGVGRDCPEDFYLL